MTKLALPIVIISCAFISSCTSLNESAQNVRYATKSEAPSSCKELGEVSAGTFFQLMTMESVKNDLRNQTSDLGGNFLVIDQIQYVGGSRGINGTVGSGGYAGSGRAYQCP
jgi:hypothetical protein